MKSIKVLFAFMLVVVLMVPSLAEAKGFSGGSSSRSFSSSSSRSSSFSSSRSSSSAPKVNLSKSSTSKSTSTRSFSGGSSTKSSATKTKSGSFSGATSTKTTTSKAGSFSGRTSTVRGRTYTSTPTRSYYNGHYVSVSHYYSAGYSPYGWAHYYSGFTTGMFMGSLMHPWGHVYSVGGHYSSYGPSPFAWIIDVVVLLILIGIVIAIIKASTTRNVIYRKRF